MAEHENKIHRHELLLSDIEGVDDNWGPTFRSIYEAEEQEKFMDKLDARIKSHDKDIERMCNHHYQEFIESIRELLQLKTQVQKLNEELVEIDTELRRSSTNVITKAEELIKARQVQKNIAAAIENLSLCLPVLLTYAKLQKQMGEKRYYPALKTLEQLEHIHLPRIPNYRFCIQMRESIPLLRDNIREASMSDLKDFLENIRKFSEKIGEVAMRHTSEHMSGQSINLENKKTNASQRNFFTGEVEYEPLSESTYDAEEDLSAQDLIDFSPVYRCRHIYTALNAKDTFETYYRNQRKQQARLVLQPPTNMHENIVHYKSYIHAIVGFFVVEDHVLNTAGTLVNRIYLDDVWSIAVSKIVNALRTNSAYCTDAKLMLRIKDLLMLFATTLRNYGYSVNPLFDLLHEMRDHYNEVLMQRWVGVFREILDEETFAPLHVVDEEDYDKVTQSFPFKDENTMDQFPRKLPFSSMVPKVYQQVKEYIYACLKFSDDLQLSQATINDMIRKSTTLLLTRTFSGSLLSLFRKPGLGLLQAVQILVDIGYLEEATEYLDEFICNITRTEKEDLGSRRQAMFHVAREDAEKQISAKLKEKMDEFLELENYDWALVEAQGHASNFITDLIVFLQSIFSSFTSVPTHVAQKSCKEACDHIAKSILGFMLSDDVKQLTMGALAQINLDTIQCEQFAASEPVPGLSEGVLLQYFAALRQLLDLLMEWDWSTYFHDFGKEDSKYKYVNPNIAIILLEKLNDNKTMFSVLKKSERDKKKLLDTVLKQLRQLAQTTQTSE